MVKRRVWKFELSPYLAVVAMPKGATLLSAGAQGDGIFVWALCDPAAETEDRAFVVVGTGEPIPAEELGAFVDTVFIGSFVFHVWEQV